MTTKEEDLREFLSTDKHPKSPTPNVPINTGGTKSVLSQLRFSEAAQKIILDPESFSKDFTGIGSIAPSSELLTQVRNSLGDIIDTLEHNPSILSRLTKYWGRLTWLEKTAGVIAVSGPTLVVGVAANVGFLLAISGISAGAYITGGAVLQDHLVHTDHITEKLKKGIFGIADVLVLTINALDTIRIKLAEEVEKFHAQNITLEKNVCALSEHVDTLRFQTESYMVTEKHLRKTKEELEKTAERLKDDLEKNQALYLETLAQIADAKSDHERCKKLLSEQISELTQKRGQLELEVEKTKALALTLQETVKALSRAVISDTTQRQSFQEKLMVFLHDKEKNFTDVADRISKAETELVSVKSQLEKSLDRHETLMHRQSQLIDRLELLDKLIPEDQATRDAKLSDVNTLCAMGFMAKPKPKSSEIFTDRNPQSLPVR